MTDAERIEQLEADMAALRHAALSMIIGMAGAVATSPEGKLELADGFEKAAGNGKTVMSDLSREVAETLRRIAVDATRGHQA